MAQGVDMFDCVMPTRNARNGTIFTRYGDLKIRNAPPQDRSPALRPHLHLLCLRGQDRGELGAGRARRIQPRLPAPPGSLRRMLGPMLATVHNLHYYLNLMQEVRDALDLGQFAALHPVQVRFERRGV